MRVLLLLSWLLATAALTLAPTGDGGSTLTWCVFCGETGGSDFLRNVLLFVPLGALLWNSSRSKSLVAGLAISLVIEGLQWWIGNGRTAAMGDLIANMFGAVAGAQLRLSWRMISAPSSQQRRTLSAIWAIVVVALGAMSWWSAQPWLPEGTLYVQREPLRSWADPYTGSLQFVGIGAVDLPSDAVRDATVVQLFRSGGAPFVVREVPGIAPPRLSLIARLVSDRSGTPIITLARRGGALSVMLSSNASRARLTSVAELVPGVFSEIPAGGEREHEVRFHEALLRTRVVPAGVGSVAGERSVSIGAPSPFRFWTWLLPSPVIRTRTQLWKGDALVALFCCMPLFYWYRRRGEGGSH